MGKKLVLLLICLAFISAGCDAFKSQYDEPPEDVLDQAESAEVEEESASKMIVDYTMDKTPCANVSGLLTSMMSEVMGGANEGLSEGSIILAEKKGPHTTKMVIAKDSKKLSFTVKKVSDKTVHVCDVVYEDCAGECMGVKSLWSKVEEGSIEVYELNNAQDGDVVNSGSYEIIFTESNMGDPGLIIEGGYFTDVVGEEFVE